MSDSLLAAFPPLTITVKGWNHLYWAENQMDDIFSELPLEGGDNFQFERLLHNRDFSSVGGLDEVGRGPLAGPVVAACVILPTQGKHCCFLDSKKLSQPKRQQLYQDLITIDAAIGVGIVSERTIEEINILQASLLAMQQAVEDLASRAPLADFLLVDGKFEIPSPLPQHTLIKGESKSASIAAASIVAKVVRDGMMLKAHKQYPAYNFKQNKGYPTKEHRSAIAKVGICPMHRKTFKGVKEFV